MDKSKAAAFLGRIGGKKRSENKAKAVRENGKLGGRPRTYSACPKRNSHWWIGDPAACRLCKITQEAARLLK